MIDNPKYRQQWILDVLKAQPTITWSGMFGNYSLCFGKSDKTFDKDWKKANAVFSEYQGAINAARLEEIIALEKESVRRDILTKNEALEILTKIAKGEKHKFGNKYYEPSYKDRKDAIQTISDLQGWKAPVQIENKEVTSFSIVNIDPITESTDNADNGT